MALVFCFFLGRRETLQERIGDKRVGRWKGQPKKKYESLQMKGKTFIFFPLFFWFLKLSQHLLSPKKNKINKVPSFPRSHPPLHSLFLFCLIPNKKNGIRFLSFSPFPPKKVFFFMLFHCGDGKKWGTGMHRKLEEEDAKAGDGGRRD